MSDIEIDAMASVSAALAGLEEEVQRRVLRWACERYGLSIASSPRRREGAGVHGDVTDEEIAEESPTYEYFAELFAATSPKSNEDKALVAGYWVQVNQGHSEWQSRELNKELKNLGHAIPNITDALSSNMRKKPQRVIQLKKSGHSKQAIKTYRVTTEGIVYVQGMLGGESS